MEYTHSKLVIHDTSGINAKMAQQIVQKANDYQSDMTLRYLNKEVDLKSILGIMSLAVLDGAEVEIEAYGEDANEAINKIEEILK